ncbi:hypothetical protein D3C84_1035210 [compost metagenome]
MLLTGGRVEFQFEGYPRTANTSMSAAFAALTYWSLCSHVKCPLVGSILYHMNTFASSHPRVVSVLIFFHEDMESL